MSEWWFYNNVFNLFKTKLTNVLSIQFNWFITKINFKMGCTATKETNKKTRENRLSLPDEHHHD